MSYIIYGPSSQNMGLGVFGKIQKLFLLANNYSFRNISQKPFFVKNMIFRIKSARELFFGIFGSNVSFISISIDIAKV